MANKKRLRYGRGKMQIFSLFLDYISNINTDFLFGIVGFLGYECLRIYRILTGKEKGKPFPSGKRKFYILIIFFLAFFAGTVSYAFKANEASRSIFVGFSVPSGLRTLIGNDRKSNVDSIEDIKLNEINFPNSLMRCFLEYFSL